MRSELRSGLGALVSTLLVFLPGCAQDLQDGAGGLEMDAGEGLGTEFRDESWRPPSPFIAGTALIALSQPLRCARYPLDPPQVAFTWEPSGQRRVYAAIYDVEPRRSGTEVTPAPEWAWMSGGSRSDVGRLHWGNGAPPDARNLPDFGRDAPALRAGSHWFVIWAWDEGRNLVASSEARRFFVDAAVATRPELLTCCEELDAQTMKEVCAPELPPEVAPCSGSTPDGGQSVDWPCYCAFVAAGATCG